MTTRGKANPKVKTVEELMADAYVCGAVVAAEVIWDKLSPIVDALGGRLANRDEIIKGMEKAAREAATEVCVTLLLNEIGVEPCPES
jgi:hypothetical protein